MEVKDEHPLNALAPISVTPLGIIMLAREEQSRKAAVPIVFKSFGRVIDLSEGTLIIIGSSRLVCYLYRVWFTATRDVIVQITRLEVRCPKKGSCHNREKNCQSFHFHKYIVLGGNDIGQR